MQKVATKQFSYFIFAKVINAYLQKSSKSYYEKVKEISFLRLNPSLLSNSMMEILSGEEPRPNMMHNAPQVTLLPTVEMPLSAENESCKC